MLPHLLLVVILGYLRYVNRHCLERTLRQKAFLTRPTLLTCSFASDSSLYPHKSIRNLSTVRNTSGVHNIQDVASIPNLRWRSLHISFFAGFISKFMVTTGIELTNLRNSSSNASKYNVRVEDKVKIHSVRGSIHCFYSAHVSTIKIRNNATE